MKVPTTPQNLSAFLRRRGISKSVTDVLEASDVTGSMFITFTRHDLIDLFPDVKAFAIRKKLWDFIEDLRREEDNNEEQHEDLPPASVSLLQPLTALHESDDELSCSQSAEKFTLKRSMTTPSDNEGSIKKKCSGSPPSPASTVSLSTTSELGFSDEELEFSQVPKLERTKRVKLNRKNEASESGTEQSSTEDYFQFPLTKEVKMSVKEKKDLSRKAREQLIREAFTCLQAACTRVNESGEIKDEDFQMAAKRLCSTVPSLKDKKPPSWPLKKPFCYWSTVMYQLKRRSQNVKFQEKKSLSESSKPHLPKASCSKETNVKDDSEMVKEMQKELKRKKPNFEALKEMQRLTFPRRKSFVENCDGRTIVETVLSTYPFLKHDEMILSELLLHLEEAGVKTDIKQMQSNFDKIKHCLKEDDDEDLDVGQYIERMQSKMKQQFLLFIPDETEDVEEYIKLQPITNSPILVAYIGECSNQFFIAIDKKIAISIESEDCLVALLLLMATYFVFNFAYNKESSDALLFIQCHILGLTPKRKSISFRNLENAVFR